jgi:hypothetical protein
MKKVLIIGKHPIRDSIYKQYIERQSKVTITEVIEDKESGFSDYDELVILTEPNISNQMEEDNRALNILERLCRISTRRAKYRPVVHLLLQNQTSLRILQIMDLPQEINDTFEVNPFTIEDVWATNLLVQLPDKTNNVYPRLDRFPIDTKSRQFVHVVICGFNDQAKAVALRTALIAHFPNYNCHEDLPLRTRITIIDDDLSNERDEFIACYQHLFENSFYRTVNMEKHTIEFHKPMYEGKRKDFVDVEWEFVNGDMNDVLVRQKLVSWEENDNQMLTIVISHDDDDRNLTQCMTLPQEIFEKGIPVFVRQSNGMLAKSFRHSRLYNNVYAFGMLDCGYNITLPLVKMARLLKYFYDCSYDDRGVPTVLPEADVEKAWQDEKSFVMRFSNIYNVMTMAMKMHSLGHEESDSNVFYALTKDEIHALAMTEHNRWCVERLIMGSRPCTDDEKEEIRKNISEIIKIRKENENKPENEKKAIPDDKKKEYKKGRNVHYDLCAYEELEVDPTGKNVKVYDYDLVACIPLIVKTYYENANR